MACYTEEKHGTKGMFLFQGNKIVSRIDSDSVYYNEFQHFTKKLRKRIYELRKENGYTQEDMERFELSYRQFQRIENGETINMTFSYLFKIAKAFKIKPHELLDL